jgi:hypothetical protein
MTFEVLASPAVTWEYLTDPETRRAYVGAERMALAGRRGGRLGVGSEYHCAHGQEKNVEVILDWQPFDFFTLEENLTFPLGLTFSSRFTARLESSQSGTRVTALSTPPQSPRRINHLVANLLWRLFGKKMIRDRLSESGRDRLLALLRTAEGGDAPTAALAAPTATPMARGEDPTG